MKIFFVMIELAAFAKVKVISFPKPIAPAKCQAFRPIESYQMSPEGIRAYLNGNGSQVSSPEQFVCCMPQIYRDHFLIAPSSIAGQAGSPESPRVLMHPNVDQNMIDKNVMVMSINGGAHYLPGSNSVELAFYRASTKQLEYVDVSFENGKAIVSPANPDKCMVCHGVDGHAPSYPDSPHSVFDPFGHWPRFVGGANFCNPAEDQLQLIKQRRALEAVRDGRQYRCLNREQVNSDIKRLTLGDPTGSIVQTGSASLSSFDSFFNDVNSIRVGRLIRETPDFDKFKFLLAGMENCSDFDTEAWIPPAAQSQINNLSSVNTTIAHAQTPEDYRAIIQSKQVEMNEHRARLVGQLKDRKRIFKDALEPTTSALGCDGNDENKSSILAVPEMAASTRNPTLRAYRAEQMINQPPLEVRGTVSPDLRYIFEGRGISMRNWSEDAVPGQYRVGFNAISFAMQSEPKSSDLGKILAEFPDHAVTEQDIADAKRACEDLKRISLERLNRWAAKNTSSTPGNAAAEK